MSWTNLFRRAIALFAVVAACRVCFSQVQPAGAQGGDMVELAFADEIEVEALVDFISKRTGLNILYDESVSKKKISIRSPAPVPRESLAKLLDSALRIKGLALVPAADNTWFTIQPTADLVAIAPPSLVRDTTAAAAGVPMTRVFALKNASAQRVDQVVKPFLNKPGANSVIVAEHGLLIVTDFSANLERVAQLVALIDVPAQSTDAVFLQIRHSQAGEIAQRVQQLLGLQNRSPDQGSTFQVIHDERTNQLIVLGAPAEVAKVRVLVDQLDVALTKERSPIRFHRLLHTKAVDVLQTIRTIEDDLDLTGISTAQPPSSPTSQPSSPQTPISASLSPPISSATSSLYNSAPTPPPIASPLPVVAAASQPHLAASTPASGGSKGSGKGVATADLLTNSIIVVGPPEVQQIYEDLIARLDQPRAQVLVETTIVALNTTDGFSLGVEISAGGDGDPKYLSFSSFGLSTVDRDSGRLKLTPGVGFNGAVLSADIADVVIRALKRSGQARVISAPHVLVSDNATGTISSTSQEPFESVNASNTVATTSFAGFVDAGTQIKVTPHISAGDLLQLEYSLELSSFTGERAQNLPPPRQQNKLESTVFLPDGHTIVTGGINRVNESNSIQSIPLLGDIPLVGAAFRNQTKSESRDTLFVFIRPVIVRDDRFAFLKFITQTDLDSASLPGEPAPGEPELIH